MIELQSGDFVRVRADHSNPYRAGRDGMVYGEVYDGSKIGLSFGVDRYNQPQHCLCVGIEQWDTSELDLGSTYR